MGFTLFTVVLALYLVLSNTQNAAADASSSKELLDLAPTGFQRKQSDPLEIHVVDRTLYISGQIDDRLADVFGLLPGARPRMYYRNGEWITTHDLPQEISGVKFQDFDEVVINSAGGMLYPALALAEALKENRRPVTLLPGTQCSSSCTWIYLVGSYRRMLGDSSLMFHPIYDQQGCWMKYSDYLQAEDQSASRFGTCSPVIASLHSAQRALDSMIAWLYAHKRISRYQANPALPISFDPLEELVRYGSSPSNRFFFGCSKAQLAYSMAESCI